MKLQEILYPVLVVARTDVSKSNVSESANLTMIALYFEPISNLKSTHPNNFDNTFKMRVVSRDRGLY